MANENKWISKIIPVFICLVILLIGLISLFTGTFFYTDAIGPTTITKQESFISWIMLTIFTIVDGLLGLYLMFFPNPAYDKPFNIFIFASLGIFAVIIGANGLFDKSTVSWYISWIVICIGIILVILAYFLFTGKRLLKRSLI